MKFLTKACLAVLAVPAALAGQVTPESKDSNGTNITVCNDFAANSPWNIGVGGFPSPSLLQIPPGQCQSFGLSDSVFTNCDQNSTSCVAGVLAWISGGISSAVGNIFTAPRFGAAIFQSVVANVPAVACIEPKSEYDANIMPANDGICADQVEKRLSLK